MLSALARLAPALLPAAAAAVVAVFCMRWYRGRKSRAPGKNARSLGSLRAREFESLVRDSFRQQGYKVIDPARGATESGELILRRDRETVLVQCRHWRDRKVGVEAIQALQRSMAQRGAGGGFVLTTGRFSREANAFAPGCNIRLIDGPALEGLMDKTAGATPLSA